MAQRERTYINEEQRETLKSFFKEGMTRVGSPIIIRAASTTGLDTSVIENWIGNYKRSLNASSEPRPLKAKVHIRELSPYNLFCRDILKNKGTMKDMGRWSTLGKEDKDKYCQEAAALRAHGQAQDLSPEMRDHQIKMHLKKLKLEVSKLEDLSVETAVLSFDRQKSSLEVYELSSKGAADFLHSTDTVNNFALHFKEEAGGTGRLPYQSLVNQGMTIKVAGLPNSLTFKKPSYYGRNQLEAILQAAEEISFEINAAQCNTTDTAEGMSEAMDAEDTADVVQTQSAEEILEAMCENGTELEKQSSETATTVAIVMTADEDGGNLCCVCHIHFDDRKKNASKKWRSWAQCANHGHTLHVVLKKTCVLNASVKTPCKHPEALHQ
ncbi:uncharacterized protein LOC132838386 isoform X3 [Tachysurus vachellii]|uniref:uncharacterized protein LOC132838374 isoform X4 n=1 Tax=Tachysurus vachellii TaxID=175792 RepID=UPI00296AAF0B|nr:uncharacterized protein LOC132838374 isoform X4 [Tachysurus vachellii]XP_060714664.1 uncharacterized protein LOC132838386 isoform X3 [Tachysurus vachellii]